MAARVRVTCWTCGDVTIGASAVTATIVGGAGGGYAFACPICSVRQGRAVARPILDVLAAMGIETRTIADPATLERRPAVASMTEADVADARHLLADDARFRQAVSALTIDHALEP
jgi:hypothetical protein